MGQSPKFTFAAGPSPFFDPFPFCEVLRWKKNLCSGLVKDIMAEFGQHGQGSDIILWWHIEEVEIPSGRFEIMSFRGDGPLSHPDRTSRTRRASWRDNHCLS